MNDKLIAKTLTPEQTAQAIADFNVNDLRNRDENDIKVLAFSFDKEIDRCLAQIETVSQREDCQTLSALNDKIKTLKQMISDCLSCLSIRVDDTNMTDQTMVQLTDDNDTVTDTKIYVNKIKYRVVTLDEYNELTHTQTAYEDFCLALIRKLVSLNLIDVIKFCKLRVTEYFDIDTFNNMIDCNSRWHTIQHVFSIDSVRLNGNLSMLTNARTELINSFFVTRTIEKELKKPGSRRQMTLWDDEDIETTEVSIVSEGDN